MSDDYAYLNEGFNPNSLRKAQLRNILITHDVEHPSSLRKDDLVELFNTEIVPRRAELRKRYVDVEPSSANMEQATPPHSANRRSVSVESASDSESVQIISPAKRGRPKKVRAAPRSRQASREQAESQNEESEAEFADPEPPLSPRARRSMTRKTRVTSDGQPIPDLQPTQSNPPTSPRKVSGRKAKKDEEVEIEVEKKPPASPRRMLANRKVNVNTDAPTLEIPHFSEIKLKAPPPKRKAEEDESFSTDNVFQKPAKRSKQKSIEPFLKEAVDFTDLSRVDNDDDLVEKMELDVLEFPESDGEDHVKVQLAELSRQKEAMQQAMQQEAQEQLAREQLAREHLARELLEREELLAKEQFAKEQRAKKKLVKEMLAKEKLAKEREEEEREKRAKEEQARQEQQQKSLKHEQRSRAFMPNIMDMNVSSAFAEQLEPALYSATPDTTAHSLVIPTRQEPDVSYLPDTEIGAASEVHNMLRNLPEVHLPELPEVHLPQLPEVHPRDYIPDVKQRAIGFWQKIPRVPRPRIPRVRIPRPRIPRPHIRIPLPSLPRLLFLISETVYFAVMLLALAIGTASLVWLRSEYANAEFCGVGSVNFPTFPWWVEYDTGYAKIEQAQQIAKAYLDRARPNCIVCPANGQCYQGRVVLCDSGFRTSPSLVSELGLWPLPPSCQPDWELRRKQDALTFGAVDLLAQARADALCEEPNLSDEPQNVGLEESELYERLYAKKAPQLSDEEFESYWPKVLEALPGLDEVYVVSRTHSLQGRELTRQTEYGNGAESDHAATSPEEIKLKETRLEETRLFWTTSDVNLPLKCRLRVYVWSWYLEHHMLIKKWLAVAVSVAVPVALFARQNAKRNAAKRLVDEIVQELQFQRDQAAADASGETPEYIVISDLRRKYANLSASQWLAIERLVERTQPAVRKRQSEQNGEIICMWDWCPF